MATQQIKDILDTEIPKPSFVLSPSAAAPIESNMDFSRSSARRSLNPTSGLYESVPSGEARAWGPNGDLMVTGANTNLVTRSSDINYWSTTRDAAHGSNRNTLFPESSQAQAIDAYADGGNAPGYFTRVCGTFSNDAESMYFIFEQDQGSNVATSVQIGLYNTSDSSYIGKIKYNFNTDDVTLFQQEIGSVFYYGAQILPVKGPNGGKLVKLQMQYSAPNYSGDDRCFQLYPDADGNGNYSILHHAQLTADRSNSGCAGGPIVTGNSTENAETEKPVDINVNFWNDTTMSYLVDFTLFGKINESTNYVLNPYQDLGKGYIELNSNNSILVDYGSNHFLGASTTTFERNKVAVSLNRRGGEIKSAVNGSNFKSTTVGNSLSNLLNNPGKIRLNGGENAVKFNNIRFYSVDLNERQLKILTQ